MSIKHLLIFLLLASSVSIFSQQEILKFPISHHVITWDDGSGAPNDLEIPLVMQELNKAFLPMGIQFYSCEIDTIKNSNWYDFRERDTNNCNWDDVLNASYNPKTINIYYMRSLHSADGIALGGDAATPLRFNRDYIRVVHTRTYYYDDLPYCDLIKQFGKHIHEMGHYFGLHHTFERYNNPTYAEHPDAYPNGIGQNMDCYKTGDSICDTYADIHRSLYPTRYVANYTDSNGCNRCYQHLDSFQHNIDTLPHSIDWWYKPNVHNYMSYCGAICYDHFTAEQIALVSEIATWETFVYKFKFPFCIIIAEYPNESIINFGFPDTIYVGNSDNIYCGVPTPPSDTIYHKGKNGEEKCLKKDSFYKIRLPLEMTDLDSAVWYINGDSVRKGTEKNEPFFYYFDLSDHDSLWLDSNFNDIVVEVILPPDSTKIVFKFQVNCDEEYPCEGMKLYYCCPCAAVLDSNGEFHYYWPDVSMIGDLHIQGIHICNSDYSGKIEKNISEIRYEQLSGNPLYDIQIIDGKVEITYDCDCDNFISRWDSVSLEICIDFDDGSTCCQEYNTSFLCCSQYYVFATFVVPNPTDGIIDIGYKIYNLQEALPLKIDIYDAMGNFVQNVMDAVPSSSEDFISVSTHNLTTGQYNVVFQYGDFVTSVSFIKQ